jgi:hypothetical protein
LVTSYAQYFFEESTRKPPPIGCWHVFRACGSFRKNHAGIGHSRILNAKGEILVDLVKLAA